MAGVGDAVAHDSAVAVDVGRDDFTLRSLLAFAAVHLRLEGHRVYHRDANGRVVAESDDAISASSYGMMMRRHARVAGWKSRFLRPLEYPNSGIA